MKPAKEYQAHLDKKTCMSCEHQAPEDALDRVFCPPCSHCFGDRESYVPVDYTTWLERKVALMEILNADHVGDMARVVQQCNASVKKEAVDIAWKAYPLIAACEEGVKVCREIAAFLRREDTTRFTEMREGAIARAKGKV